MNKIKKDEILKYLDRELLKIRESAKVTDEASKFTMTGYSQAGDKKSLAKEYLGKYHTTKAAELTEEYLKRLEKLKNEIIKSSDTVKNEAVPETSIDIKYDDGTTLSFILVDSAISLREYLFISSDSPLGKAVSGKKEGDIFSYTMDQQGQKIDFTGKILKIE
jgi:transcription elongation GreA/GreB family factor